MDVENRKPGDVPRMSPDDHGTQSGGRKDWLDYNAKHEKNTVLYTEINTHPFLHKKFSLALNELRTVSTTHLRVYFSVR